MVVTVTGLPVPSICSASSLRVLSRWKLGLRIRSGNGLLGALPYLNCWELLLSVGVSSAFSCPPEPVEPTRVTELKFDGEDGPLVPESERKIEVVKAAPETL